MTQYIAKDGTNYTNYFKILDTIGYNISEYNNEKFLDIEVENGRIVSIFKDFWWFEKRKSVLLNGFYESCLEYLIVAGYKPYIKQELTENNTYIFKLYYTYKNKEEVEVQDSMLAVYFNVLKKVIKNGEKIKNQRKRISKYC